MFLLIYETCSFEKTCHLNANLPLFMEFPNSFLKTLLFLFRKDVSKFITSFQEGIQHSLVQLAEEFLRLTNKVRRLSCLRLLIWKPARMKIRYAYSILYQNAQALFKLGRGLLLNQAEFKLRKGNMHNLTETCTLSRLISRPVNQVILYISANRNGSLKT